MLVDFRLVHHLADQESLMKEVFVHGLGGDSCIFGIIVFQKCVSLAFPRLNEISREFQNSILTFFDLESLSRMIRPNCSKYFLREGSEN